jgi:uncharacterized membrane protein YjjP (DUF1212 family)
MVPIERTNMKAVKHEYNRIKLFNTAVLAGELLAKYGAETYRVEETITRILGMAEEGNGEALASLTGFSASFNSEETGRITAVKRISERRQRFDKIITVNSISRQLCNGNMSLDDAHSKLEEMYNKKDKIKGHYLAMAVVCLSFTVMFGGQWTEALMAGIAGVASAGALVLLAKNDTGTFMSDILAAFSIAVVAYIGNYVGFESYNMNLAIIGGIMPMVPGVGITNAIFDTLHGDYLSGAARGLEALVIALGIAIGIFFGLQLCGIFGGVVL